MPDLGEIWATIHEREAAAHIQPPPTREDLPGPYTLGEAMTLGLVPDECPKCGGVLTMGLVQSFVLYGGGEIDPDGGTLDEMLILYLACMEYEDQEQTCDWAQDFARPV
jgi:hypothetical protein